MAKQNINVGTTANDKKGDSLRAAFQKVNANFTELYTALGIAADADLNLGNFVFESNTVRLTNANNDDSTATQIEIAQPVRIESDLTVGGDVVPNTANGGDLGSAAKPWRSLYVSNNTIYIGGTAVGIDANGNLTTNGTIVGGSGSIGNISNGTGPTTDPNSLVSSASAAFINFASDLDGAFGLGTNDGSLVKITTDGGASAFEFTADSGTGSIKFPDGTVQTTAAQAFSFSVAADDSTQREISNNELIKFIGAGGITTSSDAEGYITITGSGGSVSSLVNSTKTLSLGSDGSLTSNGALTIKTPNGIPSSVSNWVGGGGWNNPPYSNLATTGGTGTGLTVNVSAADGGYININYITIATAGTGYTAGDVITITNENNIPGTFTIGVAGTRDWQFGIDGKLTLPSIGKISNGAYDWTFGSTGNTTFPTGLTLAAARGPNTVNFTSGIDKEFQIETQTNTTGRLWNFSTDGSLTIPGDIKSNGNINIDINLSDSTLRRWSFGEDGDLTLPAGGDIKDSTGTSVLGGGGSVSSLVNGAYTVSLGSTGTLTVPASGIITAPINQEFQLQAKDANSVLRNEINLDPNNGTYMSVWSDGETSFSSAAESWATASWNNEEGLGAARFTDAQALQNFWLTGPGSIAGVAIEASINGGARTPNVFYENNNGETYGVFLGLDAVPPGGQGTTVPITSLVFYYRLQSKINMDVDGGEILVDAQGLDLDLRTTNILDLRANQNLNLRGLGAAYPVRIYTNNNTRIWEFDSTGSLTLPPDGKIYGIGAGANDRYGYMSWDGESSGDGSGFNTMRLVPDQNLESVDQYIILDPTGGVPGHIHIRAGGTQDNSGAHLYLGGEHSHVKISAGLNPPVTVMSNDNAWIFGTSGDLTIPGDIKGTANTSIIVDNVVLFANVTVEQAQPYGPSGSRVFISESAYPTLGSIVQVGDTVTIGWGAPITVTITNITGGGFWELRFNQIITAELILNPGTITITSAQVNTWTFDNDGGLTFPDGTVQTTAWTGTFSTLSVTGAVTAERFNTDQITVVGNRISTTVTNANLELECNGSGGVVINTVADATTASTVKSVGYLGLPQSATTTSGTLAIGDAGKHIYVTTAGQAIAIPDNSSVAYPIGTTLTFIAGPSATTVLIVINTDTLRLAGSTSTGTRTLAANGMATAVKVASTLWYINGIGLT
jgi:hypothetical protein